MTEFQKALLTLLEGGQGITLNVITTPAPIVTDLEQRLNILPKKYRLWSEIYLQPIEDTVSLFYLMKDYSDG